MDNFIIQSLDYDRKKYAKVSVLDDELTIIFTEELRNATIFDNENQANEILKVMKNSKMNFAQTAFITKIELEFPDQLIDALSEICVSMPDNRTIEILNGFHGGELKMQLDAENNILCTGGHGFTAFVQYIYNKNEIQLLIENIFQAYQNKINHQMENIKKIIENERNNGKCTLNKIIKIYNKLQIIPDFMD